MSAIAVAAQIREGGRWALVPAPPGYLQLWPEPNWMADDPIVDAALKA